MVQILENGRTLGFGILDIPIAFCLSTSSLICWYRNASSELLIFPSLLVNQICQNNP